MTISQRTQNPDVNSYTPDVSPGENPGPTNQNDGTSDVERKKESDVIPVPPDANPGAPVEEPPDTGAVPVGDVDDSPKRIA